MLAQPIHYIPYREPEVATREQERNTRDAEIAAWNDHFAHRSPQSLLSWAGERWGKDLVLTCSFGGAAGMVLLDMVTSVAPGASVVYIDTNLLFPETYRLIEQVQQRYNIVLESAQPAYTLDQQANSEGPNLWELNPDRCCQIRKVRPLAETLSGYSAWIAGLRRDGTASRAHTNLLEWSHKYQLVKLNPLAHWSERDIWAYIFKHDVPYNGLLDQGYRSIGCAPCTRLPTSDDPRSGRWVGFNKTECGIHG